MEHHQPTVPSRGVKQYDPAFEVSFTTLATVTSTTSVLSSPSTPSDGDIEKKIHPQITLQNPRDLSHAHKWLIVALVSLTSLCVAAGSSIYTATIPQVQNEFGVSDTVATLGLSMFVVGLGVAPLVLGPLCEFYGRRPIYVCSMTMFVVWIIPCAVAPNIQTLIIARFFNGLAGAAFLSLAASTVGDLFAPDQLQMPMMVYTVAPFMGPELGPVVGNFICFYVDWRWTFWVLLIWAGVQWVGLLLLVPETYTPVLLRSAARSLRRETGDDRWHAPIEKLDRSVFLTVARSTYRPFILLLLEPMVLLLCTLCALVLGILYLFFEAFALVFTNNYGFTLWQVGLSFIGIGVGAICGIATDPIWRKNYTRLLRRHAAQTGCDYGTSEPEFRLPPAIFGAPLIVVGLLWFGWTSQPSIHWIVPIIGSGVFGLGIVLVFSGVFTFLVESYPLYSASALAANGFTRSMFAASFPLFAPPMYTNLGYQWATFVLAMIALLLAPWPFVFYRYGRAIRARSRYAGAK